MLGTWQSVVLVDTNRDNPERRVVLAFLGSGEGRGDESGQGFGRD